MPENRAEEIVRTAVAQALERQLASFRESVVQEVLREVSPALILENQTVEFVIPKNF